MRRGGGPSIGWSWECFGAYLDIAGGLARVTERGWEFGGSAGATFARKF